MYRISELLKANRAYADSHVSVADARPTQRLAVVTCMDARIDVFGVLGLHPGEAHVIRNAGGRVTADVLRSLALSSHLLGVDTAVLMQHTRCGLTGVTDAELQARTGADIDFLTIDDHASTLRSDIDLIIAEGYLDPLQLIVGLLFDLEAGTVENLVSWQVPA